MRFYNTQQYGWDEQEKIVLHDYESYPETFNGTIDHFESGSANGIHFIPDEPNEAEPIAVFGSSEGSSNFELAEQLTSESYEVYSSFSLEQTTKQRH